MVTVYKLIYQKHYALNIFRLEEVRERVEKTKTLTNLGRLVDIDSRSNDYAIRVNG